MRLAAEHLVGEHDFVGFQAAGSPRATTVRHVRAAGQSSAARIDIAARQAEDIVMEIEANGFLYRMVRNIVGSLVEVGQANQPPEWVAEVLAGARPQVAPVATAPPQGLFLAEVRYDDSECP